MVFLFLLALLVLLFSLVLLRRFSVNSSQWRHWRGQPGTAQRFDAAILMGMAITLCSLFIFVLINIAVAMTAFLKPSLYSTLPAIMPSLWQIVTDTLAVAVLASLVSIPLGCLTGIWLSEYAPVRAALLLRPVFGVLQSVPSVFFGLVALALVLPLASRWMSRLDPEQTRLVGLLHHWSDGGVLLLTMGLSIGIMLSVFVATRLDRALQSIAVLDREAGHGVGLTRSELLTSVLLPLVRGPLVTTIIIAFNRALGETTIVLFLLWTFTTHGEDHAALHPVTHEIFRAVYAADQQMNIPVAVLCGLVLLAFTAWTNRLADHFERRNVEHLS